MTAKADGPRGAPARGEGNLPAEVVEALGRRSEAFAVATSRKDGAGNRPAYPMPRREAK